MYCWRVTTMDILNRAMARLHPQLDKAYCILVDMAEEEFQAWGCDVRLSEPCNCSRKWRQSPRQ